MTPLNEGARNLGWLALVFMVAILLYPLSLSVAAVHSDLRKTEAEIIAVKREMRYLETEFATRASMVQLEQWNDLEFGYVAPTARQFIHREKELASLGAGKAGPGEAQVRVAALRTTDMAAGKTAQPGLESLAGPVAQAQASETGLKPTPVRAEGPKSDKPESDKAKARRLDSQLTASPVVEMLPDTRDKDRKRP